MGLTLRGRVRARFQGLKGHPAYQGLERGIVTAQAAPPGRHSRGDPCLDSSKQRRQPLRLPRRPGHRISHGRSTSDAEAMTLLAMATIARGQRFGGQGVRRSAVTGGSAPIATIQARGERPHEGEA